MIDLGTPSLGAKESAKDRDVYDQDVVGSSDASANGRRLSSGVEKFTGLSEVLSGRIIVEPTNSVSLCVDARPGQGTSQVEVGTSAAPG